MLIMFIQIYIIKKKLNNQTTDSGPTGQTTRQTDSRPTRQQTVDQPDSQPIRQTTIQTDSKKQKTRIFL